MSDGVKAIFEPKSVVLVGASGVKECAGVASPALFRSVIHNMSRFYKGKTYIADISGRLSVAARDLRRVPKKCDLAILMLPPKFALKHLRKLLDKHVKAIITTVISHTQEQREQLARLTAKKGVRVLASNAMMEVINTANGLCITFERDIMLGRGNIAIISQSGGVGAAMLDWAWSYGIGLSKFASTGDGVDVDNADLIGYLAGDRDTRVICLYMEGIQEGEKLIGTIRKAVKLKPVIVLKGAVARGEAHPAISRTASLVERDEIFSAAFGQAGAIRVRDIEELFDVANALAKQPPMRGDRVAIVSNIDGQGTLAVDAVHREGLALANFSNEVTKAIANRYPGIDVANPINLSAGAGAEHHEFVLKEVLADPNVDGVLVINTVKSCSLGPEDTSIVAEVARKFKNKPVVDVAMGGENYALVHEVLRNTDIPIYNLPDRAARALRALYLYGKIRERSSKEI